MDSFTTTLEELWEQATVFRADLLAGTVVVVSGGGSGIGRATALLCAKLGAKVAICGRTPEKLEAVSTFVSSKGANVLAMPTDIRRPEQINAFFERVADQLGEPDVLINNAGGQFAQPAIDFSVRGSARWWRTTCMAPGS